MHAISRRHLLHHGTFGVGSVALACLLQQQRLLAEPVKPDLERKLLDQANAAIVKAAGERQVRFALGKLLAAPPAVSPKRERGPAG